MLTISVLGNELSKVFQGPPNPMVIEKNILNENKTTFI